MVENYNTIAKRKGIEAQNRLREFNLSSKRHRNAYEDSPDLDYLYDEKDVKEFIKLLKHEVYRNKDTFLESYQVKIVNDIIDKLIGDNLNDR